MLWLLSMTILIIDTGIYRVVSTDLQLLCIWFLQLPLDLKISNIVLYCIIQRMAHLAVAHLQHCRRCGSYINIDSFDLIHYHWWSVYSVAAFFEWSLLRWYLTKPWWLRLSVRRKWSDKSTLFEDYLDKSSSTFNKNLRLWKGWRRHK